MEYFKYIFWSFILTNMSTGYDTRRMAIDVWKSKYMITVMTFRHIYRQKRIHIFEGPDAELHMTVELYN